MKTLTKIAAFVAALVVVFFAAFWIGTAVGPIPIDDQPMHSEGHE